jgi:branched-chain amino acid aminotransferase
LGLDPELSGDSLRVLMVTALTLPPSEVYEHGIAAITYRGERPSDAAGVADAKIGNYLLAVLALRAARARGAREALIEDVHGHILEGAASNVFAVFAGKLRTPPESAAILPGITRGHVLELARAAGMQVELCAISKAELVAAQEVFVSSSIRELVPVVSIDGQPVGNGMPGPTTRQLLRSYRERATAGR